MHPESYTDATQWPEGWVDEVTFAPSRQDEAEAAVMFGEASEQDVFDEWLMTLTDHDYVAITRAIDEIRRVMKAAWQPLPLPVLAGWLDLD